VYERADRMTYEGVVSLTNRDLVSWRPRPGVQPPIMFEEFMSCEAIVRADPRWQDAMRKRGVTDFSLARSTRGRPAGPGRRTTRRPGASPAR